LALSLSFFLDPALSLSPHGLAGDEPNCLSLSLSVTQHSLCSPVSETKFFLWLEPAVEEIEKFITRQPPMGEKDDYDSENSWISSVLPPSPSSYAWPQR